MEVSLRLRGAARLLGATPEVELEKILRGLKTGYSVSTEVTKDPSGTAANLWMSLGDKLILEGTAKWDGSRWLVTIDSYVPSADLPENIQTKLLSESLVSADEPALQVFMRRLARLVGVI